MAINLGKGDERSSSSGNSSGFNAGNTGGANVGLNANMGVNQSGNYGTSSGSSFNSSSSTQDVYGAQAPYLQDVYGQAQGNYGNAMNAINGLTPSVQNQVSSAAGAAAGGYGNQLGGGFASGLAGQIGPNAYTDALKGQIASDAMKLKQQNLGSLDARAAAAGMSGSSGYRDQVNGMMDDIDENALNQMSQLGYNSFDRGIQNQMQLAGMMDQNQQAGIGNLQNIQQGSMNQFNPAMVGLNAAGQYGQIIGGPTVLGQSSAAGGSTNNSMNTGFSNGMNIGMGMNTGYNFGNNYGSNVATQTSNSKGKNTSLGFGS